jgi:Tol biopolymer transport system component
VVYELCTGRPAFPAAQESDWLDKLLHYDPPSIARLNSDVPAELERIVKKAMAKRPDERYQHASDMHADLVALRRRLESGSVETSAPTSRSRKALAWTIGVVGFLLAAAIASRVPRIVRGIQSGQKGFPTMVPRRLTSSPGWCRQPVISPDGSLIAYTSNASGNPDIWVMDVRGGAPLRLTNDPGADEEPTWYPDGSTIAFVSDRDGTRSVWKVPRLGGSAVMVVADACSPAISPDGRRIAFSRSRGASSKRIEVAPLDDVASSVVLTRDEDGLWDHLRPAWSPDSRALCYQDFRDLWIVPSEGGRAHRLTEDHQTSQNCAWSTGGESVYFSSMRESTTALWRMPATGGEPTRLTPGTGPETEPSISKDGSKLTHSTFYSDADVVLVEAASGKRTRSPCPSVEDAPAIAPDRSAVAFSSMRSGKPDLWLQPLENDLPKGDAVRLTDQPGSAGSPSFSPDGRWIAYTRVVGGERDIWIVPTRGGVPERFTDHAAMDIHPAWSPDGTQIAFSSSRSGSDHIWVAPVRDGKPAGESRPVTSGATADLFPRWSPDGRMIVFIGLRGPDSEAWVTRSDGSGTPLRVTRGAHAEMASWIGDSPDLLVSGTWGAGRMEIRRVLVSGGEFVPGSDPIIIGDTDALGEFTVSRDGRLLAVIEHVTRGELWVLEAPPGSF